MLLFLPFSWLPEVESKSLEDTLHFRDGALEPELTWNLSAWVSDFIIPEGTETSKGGKQAKDLPSYDTYETQKCTAQHDKTESTVAALIPWQCPIAL